VHKRVRIQSRRFFDEFLIQFLSSALLLGTPARAVFTTLSEQGSRKSCQTAKR
jgi:hypothetical protein